MPEERSRLNELARVATAGVAAAAGVAVFVLCALSIGSASISGAERWMAWAGEALVGAVVLLIVGAVTWGER